MNDFDDIFGQSFNSEGHTEGHTVIALVDSDTIAYRSAAATDGRQYVIGNKAFKYKKDVVAYCETKGLNVSEIQIGYFPEPVEHSLAIVKSSIGVLNNNLIGKYGNDFYLEFYHTGDKNFRTDILTTYKGNRGDTRRPENLDDCKDYVRRLYVEKSEDGLEADDLIGIRAYELRKLGIEYCIVTTDKDLKTIPGMHFNWVTGEWFNCSEVEAMKFFYAQCMAGDDTDNIPGVYGLSINDKGTGKAQKIIQSAHEEFNAKGLQNDELERYLYETALQAWVEGGPGSRGNFGCKEWDGVREDFKRSAQCLYILHEREVLWQEPKVGTVSNF